MWGLKPQFPFSAINKARLLNTKKAIYGIKDLFLLLIINNWMW